MRRRGDGPAEVGRAGAQRRRAAQWPRHPLLLLEAAAISSMVRLALRRRGAAGGADLASHLSRFTVPWRRPIDVPLGRDHQVVRCVDAVCVHRPFRSTCLPRSLTAWTMLQRRHIDAQVRVGVRGATTDFASHAWVERNSAALGEDPAVIATFTALPLGTFLSPVAQESAPPTR